MQARRFQHNLLAWFDQFGRKDLPWQQEQSGYRVWVSEVMLQQTQVTTVIPYFLRFIGQFPTLNALAAASLEDVLHVWTGLGYYARARNLHKAAQMIQAHYHGHFPESMAQLQELPGIGRSTAAAILSLGFGQHHPILDGNVKRIISRYFMVEGWPGNAAVVKQLWQLIEGVTPRVRCADFNQALMDLGSSLCSRTKPHCGQCPLKTDCKAFLSGKSGHYPTPRPKKTLAERESYFLMVTNPVQGILLEKRPAHGLWGGLWAFPQCATLAEVACWLQQHPLEKRADLALWPPFRHTFSHFHLLIKPVHVVIDVPHWDFDAERYCWYRSDKNRNLGMSAPVMKLVLQLAGLPHLP